MVILNVKTDTFQYIHNDYCCDELKIIKHNGRVYSVVPRDHFFVEKLGKMHAMRNFFVSLVSPLKSWQKIKVSYHHNDKTEVKTAYIYASRIPKIVFEEGLKKTETNSKTYVAALNSKLHKNPISFSSLDENTVNEEKLGLAFKNALLQENRYHRYLGTIFQEALITASYMTPPPSMTRMDIFIEEFREMLAPTEIRELVDKITFAELIGKHVGYGKDYATPLKIHDPSIKILIQEFNSGKWKDHEKKVLVDHLITEADLKKVIPYLKRIFEDQQFKNIMELYFNQLEEPV